jgi:hypothetical protein
MLMTFKSVVGFDRSETAIGAPDNPDFFNDIVAPSVEPTSKTMCFSRPTVDFDNLQRYLLVERPAAVDS